MPKPMTKTDASDSSEPVLTGKLAKPAQVGNAIQKVKPRYVLVENKLRQVLLLSVVGDDGKAVELRLEPLATSQPLREDRLTDQIRRFHASGQVRIR